MSRSRRAPLTARERTAIFRRFKDGETLTQIGASLERWPASIQQLLRRTGGIPPLPKVRPKNALSLSDREEISRGLSAGETFRFIAARLNRPASTVSREVKNNGGNVAYRANAADQRASTGRLRPKPCKLLQSPGLAQLVTQKLKKNWSPTQIQHWLGLTYPNNPALNVSHETIYRTLFIQARGALKKELLKHLRAGRVMRGSKKAKGQKGALTDAPSIRERPAEVEDRAIPGHWEGDLIAGFRNQSFIGTLVERHTRFVKLIKVDSKNAADFAVALAREVKRLPEEVRRTLTWDRGTEMAAHKNFTVATDVKVYFCDPHSPWQRGSNENTNGLLRQYFPKGTVLSGFTQKQLDRVAKEVNERPRQTLGWASPVDTLRKLVAHSNQLLN